LVLALKVVGEDTKDVTLVNRAISIVERLIRESKFRENGVYLRGLKMDLARLYHLVDLVFGE
jgi:hypothetical protein